MPFVIIRDVEVMGSYTCMQKTTSHAVFEPSDLLIDKQMQTCKHDRVPDYLVWKMAAWCVGIMHHHHHHHHKEANKANDCYKVVQ